MRAFRHAALLATRYTRALIRQPWYVLVSIAQPLIWLFLFGQLFRQVADLPGFPPVSYLAYLTPGVILMTAMFANSWNGMTLLDDMQSGVLDRLLTTPVARSAILNGITVQQTVSLALQSIVLIGLAAALGADLPGGLLGILMLIGISVLLGSAFGGVSMATALTVRQRESVIGMNQFLVLPGIFLSTAFMPSSFLPGWIQSIARFNPVNWAAVAAREGLLTSHPNWGLLGSRAGMLALFSIITTALGTFSFRSYLRST